MKRIIIILTAAIICIAANAQNSLKGSWSNTHSIMGITVTEMMTFDSELSGNIGHKASIDLSMNMMGVKISGEIELSMSGTFVFKDGRLAIKWNAESIQQKTIKPVECHYKGETFPEAREEMEKAMAKVVEEIKKSAFEGEVYDPVTFKKDKLTLTETDGNGKKHSETYSFVN